MPKVEDRKKNSRDNDIIELSLEVETSILLQYLKTMPKTIRVHFIPSLQNSPFYQQIITEMNNSLTPQHLSIPKNNVLVQKICNFLKLPKLKEAILTQKNNHKYKNNHGKDKEGEWIPSGREVENFEPNSDPSLKKQESFQPLEFVINPNYQNYLKMWKLYTDTNMLFDKKSKQINSKYTLFSQPRFFVKLDELREFQSSFSQKGNIVMLNMEGNKIVGKKGFAIAHKNTISWWAKKSKGVTDIMEYLNKVAEQRQKEKEKDAKEKKKEEKQEFKAPEVEEESQEKPEFKLEYKMVGHHGKITSMSLSYDQFYLLSTGTDRTIKLWCLRQKMLLAQYKGHIKTVWSVSFCPSGYFFLSASADKTIKLWVTDEPKAQKIYIGHKQDVMKADFMRNPDLIISSSEDLTIRIWNTLTTQQLRLFSFQRVVTNFTTSLSGRYLTTSQADGKLTIYDLLGGQIINSFVIPDQSGEQGEKKKNLRIHDMAFSIDEKEFSCVSSKYILIYSFDKLCEKMAKDIYADDKNEGSKRIISNKDVIYTGRDSNLVYCSYHTKGVLVVASSTIKKY